MVDDQVENVIDLKKAGRRRTKILDLIPQSSPYLKRKNGYQAETPKGQKKLVFSYSRDVE